MSREVETFAEADRRDAFADVARRTLGSRTLDNKATAAVRGRVRWVNPAWLTLFASVALCLVGVFAIDLTSGLDPDGLSFYAKRQLVFLAIGLVTCAVCMTLHFRNAAYFAWPLAVIVAFLLVFVLLPFVPEWLVLPRKGARRWISLGLFDLQPSELAKVAFVLVTAGYLQFRESYRTFFGLARPMLLAAVPMALILVEPDLGTATLFAPALLAMLVAAGAKLVHLIGTGVAGVAFAAVVVAVSLAAAEQDAYPLLRPHQVERIQAVVERFEGDDRFIDSRGFQGQQALTLVGSGGAFGNSEDKTRAFVRFSGIPEAHNDMIFAVVVNRWGAAGGIVVLVLVALWGLGAVLTAAVTKDPFGRLIVVGFAAFILSQATINIGMTIGLFPITGMTLPFVSYGGSSLVAGFIMVGLICNVGLRRDPHLWRRSFEFDDDET
ncbi:MAG: FtsW/RodA/SpoVE family cell cycle protein [Planctomycetota bacterium]